MAKRRRVLVLAVVAVLVELDEPPVEEQRPALKPPRKSLAAAPVLMLPSSKAKVA
jgi:hypothetical protein